MKTSNKILLVILLAGFGYLVFAQVALHIKYVNKDATPPAAYNAYFNDDYSFNNIKHVRITGIAQCHILYGDSVKLSVEKSNISYVKFMVSGDTLVLYGQYANGRTADYRIYMTPQNATLYIPAGVDVYAVNSNINTRGGRGQANAQSPRFDLTNCDLYTRYSIGGADTLDRYYDTLNVTARKNSQVILFRNDHFKALAFQLDHSVFSDVQAKIDRADISADSASLLVLTGNNISKLNTSVIKK